MKEACEAFRVDLLCATPLVLERQLFEQLHQVEVSSMLELVPEVLSIAGQMALLNDQIA